MSESQSGYLSPDQITNASFDTKRRGGLDPDGVKRHLSSVAATVHGLTAERDTLAAQIESLKEELAAVPSATPASQEIGETELTERLGQDAARVLSEARAAAADRVAEAEEQAATILAAAEEVHADRSAAADVEAQRIRAGAESVVEERQAEAERAAAEIIAEAQAEASDVRIEGSSEREFADADAERIVREAEMTRRQILEDLARRRSAARRQIEQLRAGRERLLASHELVRRALDEISEELTISMSEARAAAETAGHSVSDTTIEELEAEIETARLTGLLDTGPLPVIERRPKKPVKPAVSKSPVEPVPSITPKPQAVVESTKTGIVAGKTPPVEAVPADEATKTADIAASTLADAPSEDEASNDDSTEAPTDLAPVVQLDRARSEVDTATHPAKGREAGSGRPASKPTPPADSKPAPVAKFGKLESVKSPVPAGDDSADVADDIEDTKQQDEPTDVALADEPEQDVAAEPEEANAAESEQVAVSDNSVEEVDSDTELDQELEAMEDDDSVGDLFASLRSESPKPAPKEATKPAEKSASKKGESAKKTLAKETLAKKTLAKETPDKGPESKMTPTPVGMDIGEVDIDSSEMARRLKRVLADEQSRAMSKVKSAETLPSVEDILGTDDAQVEAYWVEVLGQLDDPARGTGAAKSPVNGLVVDIRRRVGNALESADGDAETAVNALRSVYRELKTQKIVPCADAVCRAAGVGVGS